MTHDLGTVVLHIVEFGLVKAHILWYYKVVTIYIGDRRDNEI